MRILIVEDNAPFAGLVAESLARSGLDSDRAGSVQEAKGAIANMDYAAVLLDLGLPDGDGVTLLQELRSHGNPTPVLIMTARNNLKDCIGRLREGADDYLAKPFAMEELVARVGALLRRPGNLLGLILSVGNVSLDVANRQLTIDEHIQLSFRTREMTLLELLMRHKGRVVTRRVFEDQLFGIAGEQESNAVDVYMHRLRSQLGDAGANVKIHTIRGIGFILSETASARTGT
jgi:DNA-binding response OmpR family regulator